MEETSLKVKITITTRSKKVNNYEYYYIVLENAAQLSLQSLNIDEITEIKWCSHDELKSMDCNLALRTFRAQWTSITRNIREHQRALSVTGSIPSKNELEPIRNNLALEWKKTVKKWGIKTTA